MNPHTSRKLMVDRARSRRSFLRGSTLATAAGAGLVLAECSETRAGTLRPSAALVGAFDEIRSDEIAHVAILQTLLVDPDNPLMPNVRKAPMLRNLVQPNFTAFVEAAATFENTGSGTYGGALFAVQQTMEYFPIAVGLTTVEARHASFLNNLLGNSLVPEFAPVESPIPQTVTLSRVAPFIANLNGTTPSFDPLNASDANNFLILDFLLLLEYIESAFYIANVKHFLGM